MKNYLTGLVVFVVISIIALYFLIPTSQHLAYQTSANCTESGASRQIINKGKWQLWWPGKKEGDIIYSYRNCKYRIDKILLTNIETTIFNDKDSIKGYFNFTATGIDSTQFQWISTYHFSPNPIKRFTQYFQFNNFKNNVENLLAETKKYFDNPENIYGMKIVQQKVTEPSYISVKNTFSQYPSTHEIYDMIQSLKEYILKKGDEEKGFPMLHVEQEGPSVYETLVAIPTKSELPSEGKFNLKKMILGNILMAEIKGGNSTIIRGEKELANYVTDYKKMSPAIAFQSLVTNRLTEADTSKWVTRLYYPIFQ